MCVVTEEHCSREEGDEGVGEHGQHGQQGGNEERGGQPEQREMRGEKKRRGEREERPGRGGSRVVVVLGGAGETTVAKTVAATRHEHSRVGHGLNLQRERERGSEERDKEAQHTNPLHFFCF